MTAQKMTVAQKAATKVDSKLNSRPVYISIILGTAFLFVAVLTFNFLAANPNLSGGLFHYGQAEVSKLYPVNITPAGWAFSIWSVIYLTQLAWIIYTLSLLCRTTDDGEPAYLNPIILSPAFLVFFNLSSGFNIGWLFLWDRFLFLAGLVFLVCIAVSLYLTLAIGGVRIVTYQEMLINHGRKSEVKFLIVAVMNGLAMYAAWTTIATLINLNVVLVYKWSQPFSQEMASIISLSILAFVIVLYVALDVSVFDRYTRYAISPYLVVIWATSAIVSKNWNAENTSSVMCAVILGAVSLATLIKVTLLYVRSRNEMYQYRQMRSGRRPQPLS